MGSASWQRFGSLTGWRDFGHEDTAVTRNDRMRAQLGSLLLPGGQPQLSGRSALSATSGRHSRDRVDVRMWGTKRTSPSRRSTSAFGGEADLLSRASSGRLRGFFGRFAVNWP